MIKVRESDLMKPHMKKRKNFKVCDVIKFVKIKRFKIGSEG